jgi:hypothetical protein
MPSALSFDNRSQNGDESSHCVLANIADDGSDWDDSLRNIFKEW